jgi:hypothetical protein
MNKYINKYTLISITLYIHICKYADTYTHIIHNKHQSSFTNNLLYKIDLNTYKYVYVNEYMKLFNVLRILLESLFIININRASEIICSIK